MTSFFNLDNYKDKIVLIHQLSMGDLFYICALKPTLERKYGARVHFVIKPNLVPILKMFGFSDYSVKVFNQDELKKIAKENTEIKIGKLFIAHPLYGNDYNKIIDEFHNSKISFVDIFKKSLGLPLDTPLEYPANLPVLSDDLRSRLEKIAPLEKIIMLSSEANSTSMIPPLFLENEVAKLVQDGYVVISSVIDKLNAPKGSVYLKLNFDEAFALATSCHKVISVRSGFSDIIAPFVRNHVVYYPDINTFNEYSFSNIGALDIEENVAPNFFMKKIGPFFQIEQKNNQNFYKIAFTLFRVKADCKHIKFCFLGVPIWIIKKFPVHKIHLLFGVVPVFKEKI